MKLYEVNVGLKKSKSNGEDMDNWDSLKISARDFADALAKSKKHLSKNEYIVDIHYVTDFED